MQSEIFKPYDKKEFLEWSNSVSSYLSANRKPESLPLDTVWIDDNLETVRIGIKAVFLQPNQLHPAKIMIGFKFDPKPTLPRNAYNKILMAIRNGEFLPYDFRDFICAKISKIEHMRQLIHLLGKTCRLLFDSTVTLKDEQTRLIMLDSLKQVLKEGWDDAGTNNKIHEKG